MPSAFTLQLCARNQHLKRPNAMLTHRDRPDHNPSCKGARIMDDSDNTTTLPSVTRRRLLTGTIATTAAWPLQDGAAIACVLASNPSFDPTLSLWREWNAAYLHTAALCRKQQRLETKLVGRVGFPQAQVHLPDEDVTVSWLGDIEELLGDDPALADIRSQAEADLAAHQARWAAGRCSDRLFLRQTGRAGGVRPRTGRVR